ncbi:MAG: sulfatase-like hydrolase/transferase [Bacteroidales bacterium]|nr:sulfatase-like hydrolase/transferase [Bacteroidales bacterium]
MHAVVITLHGCPLAAFGAYGNEWIVTPHLDRLAAESVVFDQHISDCPDPVAARRTWRTGQLAQPPAAVRNRPTPDLLTLLTSAGVESVLVIQTRPENLPTDEFQLGWSRVLTISPDDPDALCGTLTALLPELQQRSAFLLWLELDRLLPPWDVPQEVFQLYIADLLDDEATNDTADDQQNEYADEHDDDSSDGEEGEDALSSDEDSEDDAEEEAEPATPPEPVQPWTQPPVGWFDRDDLPSWELLHRSFAAVVSGFDAELGRVFDLFREHGLDTTAHWILTTDFGYPLGEHGMIGRHRPWLHEELIHLPLLMRLANAHQAGTRVSALTQPMDLLPTLARIWAVPVPDGGEVAVDWLALADDPNAGTRTEALTVLTLGSASEVALRTVDRALLLPLATDPEDDPREPQLYEKPADRWEVNNIRQQDLDRAEEWEQQLRARFTSPPE